MRTNEQITRELLEALKLARALIPLYSDGTNDKALDQIDLAIFRAEGGNTYWRDYFAAKAKGGAL